MKKPSVLGVNVAPTTRRHFLLAAGLPGLLASLPLVAQATDIAFLPIQRSVQVSTQSQFEAALSGAVAGDHIVLANGTYSGPGNWMKNGTQDNPIVVRSANLLGALINGTLNPNGSNLIFHGLDFQSTAVNVGNIVQANRVKLWRCRWRDNATPSTLPAVRTYGCNDIDIAYCEWTNWSGRGVSLGIAAGTRRPHIRRCLFHNKPAGWSSNATEAIQVGYGRADRNVDGEALIEQCRFAGWDSDDEVISIKSSSNTLRQCTFDDNSGRLGSRMGKFNQYQAIWCTGSNGIRIHDKGNLVLGCRFDQAALGLRIATGNHDADVDTMPSNLHPNAVKTYIAGCRGTVTIAHAFTGHEIMARDTTLRQHDGAVNIVPGTQTNTSSQPAQNDTLYAWPALLWLDNQDVGPYADLN